MEDTLANQDGTAALGARGCSLLLLLLFNARKLLDFFILTGFASLLMLDVRLRELLLFDSLLLDVFSGLLGVVRSCEEEDVPL